MINFILRSDYHDKANSPTVFAELNVYRGCGGSICNPDDQQHYTGAKPKPK
jgi:hypothetical protein